MMNPRMGADFYQISILKSLVSDKNRFYLTICTSRGAPARDGYRDKLGHRSLNSLDLSNEIDSAANHQQ